MSNVRQHQNTVSHHSLEIDVPVVVFDGVCNLCNTAVQFILDNETDQALHFAAAQSPAGQRLLRRSGFDTEDLRTFVFMLNGQCFTKAHAATRVAEHLRYPWRAARILRFLPHPLLDWCYDRVANNRYQWFGKRDVCMTPRPGLQARFIVD